MFLPLAGSFCQNVAIQTGDYGFGTPRGGNVPTEVKGDKNKAPREEISKGRAGSKVQKMGKLCHRVGDTEQNTPSNAHGALGISKEPADVAQWYEETGLCPETRQAGEWKQALQFQDASPSLLCALLRLSPPGAASGQVNKLG